MMSTGKAIRVMILRAAAWPFRVAAARATMRMLANMDHRELADLGLVRSDLRDASALALDRDPTALLAQRAHERRGAHGLRRLRQEQGNRIVGRALKRQVRP